MGWTMIVEVFETEPLSFAEPAFAVETDQINTLGELTDYLDVVRHLARGGDLQGDIKVEVTLPPRTGRAAVTQLAAAWKRLLGEPSNERDAGRQNRRRA
jgi:hypothetical protein